jgi:hypothetical protein
VDSISNQSHALDFGKELQKLHKKRFSRKCMLAERSIHRKHEAQREQTEKEEDMVGAESQEKPEEKQNGRKGRRA